MKNKQKTLKEIREMIINVAVLYRKEVLSDCQLMVAAGIIIEEMDKKLNSKSPKIKTKR